MIRFFAVNATSGRVEGFYTEAMRDEFVRCGCGRAVSRSEAKDIMLSYVLNFAAGIAHDLTRVAIAQDARATDRLFHYYENVEQLIAK